VSKNEVVQPPFIFSAKRIDKEEENFTANDLRLYFLHVVLVEIDHVVRVKAQLVPILEINCV
jgi:hypothetical protein